MSAHPRLPANRAESRLEHLMTEITAPATDLTSHHSKPAIRWRRWLPLTAGAIVAGVIAAIVVVVGVTPSHPRGATAFAVEPVADGSVAVKVVNTDASAREMTAQLHAAGLRVDVATEPASPQLVGTWVGASFSADVPQALAKSIISQTDGYTATLDIPKSLAGDVILYVGVTTPTGELPQVIGLPNALAPGGRLACLNLSGADPAQAAAALTARGYTLTWTDSVSAAAPTLTQPPAGSQVTDAFISDDNPKQVAVVAIAPSDSRYAGSIHIGYPLDQRTATGVAAASC